MFALFFFSLIASVNRRIVPCHYFHVVVLKYFDLGYFSCLLTNWSVSSNIILHYMLHTGSRVIQYINLIMVLSCLKSLLLWLSVQWFQRLSLRIHTELVVWKSLATFICMILMSCQVWEALAYRIKSIAWYGRPPKVWLLVIFSFLSCHFLFYTWYFSNSKLLAVIWIPCNFIFVFLCI